MASSTPTSEDSEADLVADLIKTCSNHNQLIAASVPFQCSKRCNDSLPNWKANLDLIIDQLLKTGSIEMPDCRGGEVQTYTMGHGVATTIKDLVKALFVEKGHLDRVKECGCGGKNADSANALKLVGNELFKEGEYLMAIKFYSVALTTCQVGMDLAVLYGNRSAASACFGQFENALEDIALAMRLNYPSEKQGKLLLRKADCLFKLGRLTELREFMASTASMAETPFFSSEEQARWETFKRQSSSLNNTVVSSTQNLGKYLKVATVIEALSSKEQFRTGNKFPWLSAKVKIVRETGSKYRIVASEKIETGEVLAVVKPFAVIPLNENKSLKNLFDRCHHCTATIYRSSKYIDNPKLLKEAEEAIKKSNDTKNTLSESSAPYKDIRMNNAECCYYCSDVLFCSFDCHLEAWNTYHRFECGHLHVLRTLPTEAHLALRVLYSSCTANQTQQLFSEAENLTGDECTVNLNSLIGVSPILGKLDEIDDDYRRLFYSTEIKEDLLSKIRFMITSNLLLELGTRSAFFKKSDDFFFGVKMLIHLQSQLKRHIVIVGRRNDCSQSPVDAYDRFQVATGLTTIVEAADKDTANVHLQPLNPLEIVCSNVLLLTAKRSIDKGEKLSLNMLDGQLDTSVKVPLTDMELLGRP